MVIGSINSKLLYARLQNLCSFPEILHFNPDPGISLGDQKAAVVKGWGFQFGFYVVGETESLSWYLDQPVIHPVIPVFIIQQTDGIGPGQEIIQDDLHHSLLE